MQDCGISATISKFAGSAEKNLEMSVRLLLTFFSHELFWVTLARKLATEIRLILGLAPSESDLLSIHNSKDKFNSDTRAGENGGKRGKAIEYCRRQDWDWVVPRRKVSANVYILGAKVRKKEEGRRDIGRKNVLQISAHPSFYIYMHLEPSGFLREIDSVQYHIGSSHCEGKSYRG